jgi:hypothetical protein
MTDQMETFTASTEGRLVECLGLAHALPAMIMLAVHTVKPAWRVTVVMLPGVFFIVYLVQILLTTVLWRVMGTSTA